MFYVCLFVFLFFWCLFFVCVGSKNHLGSRSLLPPENIERFINFLSPNASEKNASRINFKDLCDVNVKSIGLFGTKKQLCDMLEKLDLADENLYEMFVSVVLRSF